MKKPSGNDFPSITAKFFYNLSLLSFCMGQPNFWIEDLSIPKTFAVTYRFFSRIISVLIYIFILSEYAAIFTQKNLSMTQESNLMVYVLAHPMMWSYSVTFGRQTDNVRKIIVDIINLKQEQNDVEAEKKMIKKSKLYSSAFVMMCGMSMSLYTFDAFMQVIKTEGTFTTVITAWPMVDDTSASANLLRFMANVLWWLMMSRAMTVYVFVFTLTSCMSHLFIDLRNYFISLNDIFAGQRSSQRQKELKYETAYKVGIKLHLDTLKCVELSKSICWWLFSGQIIFNMIMLVILMTQFMKSERNLMHAAAIALAAYAILVGTGLFMCNAGDVSVEAAELCTAMYSSGWENCQGHSTIRVRKLVVTSMMFAQATSDSLIRPYYQLTKPSDIFLVTTKKIDKRPVVINVLGIMELSYQSFVSVVKSTYSVFSLVFQQAS